MPIKTSPMINTPKMADDNGKPLPSSGIPKLNLGPFPDNVDPINANSIPSTPTIIPFIGDDPDTAAINDSDRMISAPFSGKSRILSMITARIGAAMNKAKSLMVSPQTELKCATLSALGP